PLPGSCRCGRRYPPGLYSTRPETRRISAPLGLGYFFVAVASSGSAATVGKAAVTAAVTAVTGSGATGTAPPAAPVAVVAGTALLGLDFEHESLDGDDTHRIAGVDRRGPVRAGAPAGALDDDDA